MTRPIIITRRGPGPASMTPAVAFLEMDDLTIAVSARSMIAAAETIQRALPDYCGGKAACITRPFTHRQLMQMLDDADARPRGFKSTRDSFQVDPSGLYLQQIMSGQMTKQQALMASHHDIIEGVYFGVGGPITNEQTGRRTSSLIMLGEWR